jgi:hypothetical protein
MTKDGKQVRPGEITTGIVTWLRTGKINPSVKGFKRIRTYLRALEKDLIAEKGGPENLTAAQEILIRTTIQSYGVLLLASAYTQKYSILRPDQAKLGIIELQPVLGHQFIAFQNSIRQNLVALGIDRREIDTTQTLAEIEAEIAREREEKAKKAKEVGEKKQSG